MLRATPDTQHSPKWALTASRDAMAIGQQLRVECELPPKPAALPIRKDGERDPYADIVGTC